MLIKNCRLQRRHRRRWRLRNALSVALSKARGARWLKMKCWQRFVVVAAAAAPRAAVAAAAAVAGVGAVCGTSDGANGVSIAPAKRLMFLAPDRTEDKECEISHPTPSTPDPTPSLSPCCGCHSNGSTALAWLFNLRAAIILIFCATTAWNDFHLAFAAAASPPAPPAAVVSVLAGILVARTQKHLAQYFCPSSELLTADRKLLLLSLSLSVGPERRWKTWRGTWQTGKQVASLQDMSSSACAPWAPPCSLAPSLSYALAAQTCLTACLVPCASSPDSRRKSFTISLGGGRRCRGRRLGGGKVSQTNLMPQIIFISSHSSLEDVVVVVPPPHSLGVFTTQRTQSA